jgi:hypothetical protein
MSDGKKRCDHGEPVRKGRRRCCKRRYRTTIPKDMRVEILITDRKNPRNPYSYLTPQERGKKLVEVWAKMFAEWKMKEQEESSSGDQK